MKSDGTVAMPLDSLYRGACFHSIQLRENQHPTPAARNSSHRGRAFSVTLIHREIAIVARAAR